MVCPNSWLVVAELLRPMHNNPANIPILQMGQLRLRGDGDLTKNNTATVRRGARDSDTLLHSRFCCCHASQSMLIIFLM